MRAAYSVDSCSDAYFVRGQKKPRSPSPLVRGTTWTCRCGTDWLTTLFTATNEPCAPRPSTAAAAKRWAAPSSPAWRSAGRSSSVSTCVLGTSSTCPLKTGRRSRKPRNSPSSSTTSAGRSPATIEQKTQSMGDRLPRPLRQVLSPVGPAGGAQQRTKTTQWCFGRVGTGVGVAVDVPVVLVVV